jgi:hypothetical protein
MLQKLPFSCGNFSDIEVQRVAEGHSAGVMNTATLILMPGKRNLCTTGGLKLTISFKQYLKLNYYRKEGKYRASS